MHCIYIAGKYTGSCAWEVKKNILKAELLGAEVVSKFGNIHGGVMVIIPHTNTAHWEGLQSDEWFYKATMELLKRCDAMIYVPGDQDRSYGTKMEILHCQETNKPYFPGDQNGLADFLEWLKVQNNE